MNTIFELNQKFTTEKESIDSKALDWFHKFAQNEAKKKDYLNAATELAIQRRLLEKIQEKLNALDEKTQNIVFELKWVLAAEESAVDLKAAEQFNKAVQNEVKKSSFLKSATEFAIQYRFLKKIQEMVNAVDEKAMEEAEERVFAQAKETETAEAEATEADLEGCDELMSTEVFNELVKTTDEIFDSIDSSIEKGEEVATETDEKEETIIEVDFEGCEEFAYLNEAQRKALDEFRPIEEILASSKTEPFKTKKSKGLRRKRGNKK